MEEYRVIVLGKDPIPAVDGFKSLVEAERFEAAVKLDLGNVKTAIQRWVDFDESPDGWQTVFNRRK